MQNKTMLIYIFIQQLQLEVFFFGAPALHTSKVQEIVL